MIPLLSLALACEPASSPQPGGTLVEPDDSASCGALCELEVSTSYDCDGDTGAERQLQVSTEGSTLTVLDADYGAGCCPEFTARAVLAPEAGTLELVYSLDNDFCDCICSLSLSSRIEGVPSGSWTLKVEGLEESITVP